MRLLRCCGCIVAVALLGDCQAKAAEAPAAPTPPLRVLTSSPEPFYFVDEQGRVDGFEHKILDSFARAQNRRLEVVWIEDFGEVLDALVRGDGDVVASTLTITDERRQRVDFSAPYFPVRVVLVERASAASQGIDSLRGKKVVSIKGTTYDQVVSNLPGVERVYAETDREMYEMVASERADALACDTTNFLWIGRDYPLLTITASLSDRAFYGFAVRRGDPLRQELDAHIERIRRDGSYARFLRETFDPIAAAFLDKLDSSEFLPRLADDGEGASH